MPTTIFADPLQYALTCVVLVVAQLVYVLFGFGSGLIAVGTLALVFPDLRDVVVLLLLVNLPAELLVVSRSRHFIRWRPMATLGVGIGLGIPVGTWILGGFDAAVVLTVLGWFLVATGLVFLRLPSAPQRPPGWLAGPTGLLSGVLTGLFGTGGPPIIVWYHLAGTDKAAFRGNLMAIFLLMSLVRVPSYVVGGLVTAPRLWSTLAVMPAVLLGAWLGHRLHIAVSEILFRRLVSGLLAVLGVVLLLR
ncbi:MAG: sulfite exporter TauE/SafE family protein [bacterium]|nr:sulfite exporter TauE/SafE family protein [bacterium]